MVISRERIGDRELSHNVTQAHALLHCSDLPVLGDAGYQGAPNRRPNKDLKINSHIAMRPSKRKALGLTRLDRLREWYEQANARIRAKAVDHDHPFPVVKNLFRHRKTRYRGLAKNTTQLFSFFALANLVVARRRLFALDAHGSS